MAEYEPATSRLRVAYTNCSARLTVGTVGADGKPTQVMTQFVKVGDAGFVIESVTASITPDGKRTNSSQVVGGVNSRYRFDLTRNRNESDYVLTGVLPTTSLSRSEVSPVSFPIANQQPAGRTYLDLVRNPNTTVAAYTDVVWLGRPAKRLIVEFGMHNSQSQSIDAVRIAVMFRPDEAWVCCGWQLLSSERPDDPPVVEDRYSYTPRAGELPAPKLAERWVAPAGPSARLLGRTDITEFTRHTTPPPDRDFTLTAYKLPEPEGMTEPDPRLVEGGGAVPALFPAAPSRGGGMPWWAWPVAVVTGVTGLLMLVYRPARNPKG